MLKGLIAIVGLLLLALFVACGGGDDDDATSATDRPTATEASNGGDDGGDATPTEADDEEDETETPDSGEGDDDVGETISYDGPSACELLDEALVEQLMEDEVEVANDDTSEDGTTCLWEGDEFNPGLAVDLTVFAAAQEYLDYWFTLNEDDAEPIEGLGDRAHWTGSVDVIEVIDGDYDISIQIIDISGSDPDQRDEATAMAEAVIAGLE